METYEQELNGKIVMIVEFDEMPELPIRGDENRRWYNQLLMLFGGQMFSRQTKLDHYAEALTLAIENGIVPGPGKYAIWLSPDMSRYEIYGVFD